MAYGLLRAARVGAVLLGLGCCFSWASTAHGQSGYVTFDAVEYDFGLIQEGAEAAHTFVFTNSGDGPVRLLQVRPSCGCTTPAWTSDPVGPGETGSVTAVFDSDGLPGPFDKSITIHTDGKPEVLRLRIRGDVSAGRMEGIQKGALVVANETIRFSNVRVGPPAVTSLRIQNVSAGSVRIDSVHTSDARLFTDYGTRTLQPGQSDEITFILDTEGVSPGESIALEVVVVTDDPSTREIRLPVAAMVE